MKAIEWRSRSVEELKTELKSLKGKQYQLRFKKAVDVIMNPGELREIRKDIARILTILLEKQRKEEGSREKDTQEKGPAHREKAESGGQ